MSQEGAILSRKRDGRWRVRCPQCGMDETRADKIAANYLWNQHARCLIILADPPVVVEESHE